MTNAEQWLADLEAKAKAYKSSSTYERLIAKDDYFAAATPETVLRLVGMVRFLAFSAARSRGLFMDPAYWIDTAYIATEDHHDQLP